MECQERENNQYLGTVYPSIEERVDGSKAGRTELYLCGTCHQASRFPRFNSMSKVKHSAAVSMSGNNAVRHADPFVVENY